MILWIVLTVMTAAVAVALAAPVQRRLEQRAARSDAGLDIYREQLAEIEREKAAGGVDAAQADAAALEIKRRLLAAARDAETSERVPSLGERHLVIASVTGLVALGSTILYSNMGRPDVPSVSRAASQLVVEGGETRFQPVGARPPRPTATARATSGGAGQTTDGTTAATAPPASSATAPTGAAAAPQVGSLDDMIQRLVDRAAKDPGKTETWRMLGWSYSAIDRYPEAVDAYAKAVALEPRNAGLQAALGEARARAAGGKVTPEALAAIDAALAVDAREPRARFVKGLALEQSGRKREALELWRALERDAGPNDAWAEELRERTAALGRELGLPAADAAAAARTKLPELPPPPADAMASNGALTRGPDAGQIRAAEAMAPADRTAMIRTMVDGLAQRLEKSPRDADGWIQLIRSRKVMGEADAAKAALTRALAVFADAPDERSRIAAAAAQLGVASN